MMKMRSCLLTVVAAISGLAMFATPAEAGSKKHHRHHYWEDEGRYKLQSGVGQSGLPDYQPYYRGYYREPYNYGPVYDRGPVFELRFRSN